MKIHLTINSELEETEVHIHAKEYTEQIERLMKQLQASQTTMLDGYFQQEIHMLKFQIFTPFTQRVQKYFCRRRNRNSKQSVNYMSWKHNWRKTLPESANRHSSTLTKLPLFKWVKSVQQN